LPLAQLLGESLRRVVVDRPGRVRGPDLAGQIIEMLDRGAVDLQCQRVGEA
jgi:hypothetical protein